METKKLLPAIVIVIVIIIAVAAYLLTIPPPPPPKKFRVAMVIPGDITDLAWNQAGYEGLMKLAEDPGIEVAYVEGVYEAVDALPHFRAYAEAGYDLVIGHGFQYYEALLEVAKDFPNIMFLGDTGLMPEKPPANFALADVRTDQTGYLEGILAARMTKTNKLGFISGLEVGELARNYRGFAAGVKSVNPAIGVFPVYTGDFHDVEGAKHAAIGLAEAGVDVVDVIGDGVSRGGILGCKEKGVWVIGNGCDVSSLAPEVVLTSGVWRWEAVYRQAVKDIKEGKYKPTIYWVDLASGGLTLSEFHKNVPADVKAEIDKAKEKIIAGELLKEPLGG